MSDQDRDKLAKGTEDAEETSEDVDAHVKRFGNDEEGGAGDDVEAHVKTRNANDDDGDDVEAHVKQAR